MRGCQNPLGSDDEGSARTDTTAEVNRRSVVVKCDMAAAADTVIHTHTQPQIQANTTTTNTDTGSSSSRHLEEQQQQTITTNTDNAHIYKHLLWLDEWYTCRLHQATPSSSSLSVIITWTTYCRQTGRDGRVVVVNIKGKITKPFLFPLFDYP